MPFSPNAMVKEPDNAGIIDAGHILVAKPIQHKKDHCYAFDVPLCCPLNPRDWSDSRWYVFEDGKPLGPRNTPFPLIAQDGMGRFTYYRGQLCFSTSDNTDPNTNGRQYSYARSDDLYFSDRFTYCLNQVKSILYALNKKAAEIRGLRVLEIGPGQDLGIALIMSGLGATTVGVEKYLTNWSKDWHAPFIETICKNATEHFPSFDPTPLHHCLKEGGFATSYIQQLAVAMEDFDPTLFEPFDISYSLAALEHVSDAKTVTQKLFQATRAGGKGYHAIDFRDHRDFTRPLEFYLLDDEEFRKQSAQCLTYNFGSRVPASHFTRLFKEAGFSRVNCTFHGSPLNEDYLQDFLPRIRASTSRFKDISEEDMRMTSAYYILEKE